jgi:predicted RNase H-like nuclease
MVEGWWPTPAGIQSAWGFLGFREYVLAALSIMGGRTQEMISMPCIENKFWDIYKEASENEEAGRRLTEAVVEWVRTYAGTTEENIGRTVRRDS